MKANLTLIDKSLEVEMNLSIAFEHQAELKDIVKRLSVNYNVIVWVVE